MKYIKDNPQAFKNQRVDTGIDVHRKSWRVSPRGNGTELKNYSQNASPRELYEHLSNTYPGAEYYTVYEAGYCGFWIHEELTKMGIKNIVVNPADVPTKHKEKVRKTDRIDARKLARELEKGNLEGIYIPSKFHQELRSLCRLRSHLVTDQTRMKNRIKAHMAFFGKSLPAEDESKHWSAKFIKYLREVKFSYPMGKRTLEILLDELGNIRKAIVAVTKALREYAKPFAYEEIVKRLYSTVPGVGYTTAISFYTEIMDIQRFPDIAHLASFVGFTSMSDSSGEEENDLGMTVRRNKYLRTLLIEAAWIAIRVDPAMYLYFSNQLKKGKERKKVITAVAKKLLSRMRHVWLYNQDYVCGVIQ